jgi:hypothetical protein
MLLTRGSLTSRLMPSDRTTPIPEKLVRKFGCMFLVDLLEINGYLPAEF